MPATYTDRLDGLTTSVAVKAPCRVTAITPIELSGLQSIDGVTVEAGDRVLAQAQANPVHNGIWMVGTGVWRRSLDFDGTRDAVGGTLLKVVEGSANANTYWDVVGHGPINIGSDEIQFRPTSGNITLQSDLVSPTGSSLIGFLHTALNAVTRTVKAKLLQMPLTPEDFRSLGDTDTQALTRFAAGIGGGINGQLDNAYTVTAVIDVLNKSHFRLFGNGSIKMADGAAADDGHAVIRFTGCDNFSVEDITFDGNRANRTPAESSGHNVRVRSCSYGVFRNVASINSVTDGYHIASETPTDKATHSHHMLFDNCIADNSYRNGMSIIQMNNSEVRGGSYRNTTGTAPQAGIDIESNAGDAENSNELLHFTAVDLSGNAGYGLAIAGPSDPRRIWITDCSFIANAAGAMMLAGADIFVARPIVSGGGSGLTRGVIDVPSSASEVGRIEINAPKFRNITTTTQSLLYVHSVSVGSVTMLNVDCDSCARIADFQAPNCRLQGGVVSASTLAVGAVSFGAGATRGEVSGLTLSNFNRTAILSLADDVRIVENTLREPTSNDNTGIIRVFSGSGATVRANKLVRASSGAGYGIVSAVKIDRLEGNRVEGFTGNPYALTGTPIVARGNIENGALRTGETVIA